MYVSVHVHMRYLRTLIQKYVNEKILKTPEFGYRTEGRW